MATRLASSPVLESLEHDGVAVLPNFITGTVLREMQEAFRSVLQRPRWNDFDGYEQTMPYQHMVQNVLTLHQGFLDAALHPMVADTMREYIGEGVELVEAKGWKSLPTHVEFNGWHGDAWYDQSKVDGIPREVKLAIYLTDVLRSSHFEYVRGSHRQQRPRAIHESEVANVPRSEIIEVRGTAGTAFMFDTSGTHRQAFPILDERHAVFLTFHNPSVPLQKEDVDYYRYHPLILNAAFLGNLTDEDQRLLGFGNKTNYVHAFQRKPRHEGLQNTFRKMYEAQLRLDELQSRVKARLNKGSAKHRMM